MRFSKAPLIATLMAVVLSLLVILPALAENTDGQVYQGRTLSDELIVAVFSAAADSRSDAEQDQTDLNLASGTRAYMVSDPEANPRDTFFDGKLYVSNQAKAFNTVLVTHLGAATPVECLSVEVRNNNTGSKITLSLVPSSELNDDSTLRYYQNYFMVIDRDGANQDENHDGMPTCQVVAPAAVATPITSGTIATDGDDAGTEIDESLARINASDGDKLTIRAGTHIQEIYVDGEAPTFSEITPADGARFKDAALRLGFELRDDGAGLRHDGENVISNDLDAVLHDAANALNNMQRAVGDEDGITEREPISEVDGGSEDIAVTFYKPKQVTAKADAEAAVAARAKSDAAGKAARDAAMLATTAAELATTARGTISGTGATNVDDLAARDAAARALNDNSTGAAAALQNAATALTAAGMSMANENPTAPGTAATTARAAATTARTAAMTADGVTVVATDPEGTNLKTALGVAAEALRDAADALDKAAEELDAAAVADVVKLDADAVAAETKAGLSATAAQPDGGVDGTPIDDHGSSGWVMVERGVAYEANIVYNITDQLENVFGYQWMVSATDRVGNTGDASKERFDLTVDTMAPQVSEARTGISYDVDKNRETRDRSYIALTFVNAEKDGTRRSGEDPILASTLDVRDFVIAGYEVVDIIQPDVIGKKDSDAVAIDQDSLFENGAEKDPRSRVYLKLDSELGSAETPTVQILGGAVSDLAGNLNSPPQSIKSKDKIPAGLTITVTSSDSSSGRVVATEDGTFTVMVDADEPLRHTPRLYFSRIGVTVENGKYVVGDDPDLGTLTLTKELKVSPLHNVVGTDENPAGGNAAPALEVIERDRAWTGDYDADEDTVFDDDKARVYALLVWSEDTAGNAGGSSGWMDNEGGHLFLDRADKRDVGPRLADTLDLAALDDAGLLIEIDRGLAKPAFEVLPSAGDDKQVTESPNPYLQLKFSETAENTAVLTVEGVPETPEDDNTDETEFVAAIPAVTATFTGVKDGSDTTALDAHKKVTLTAVTVDDVDVSGQVGPGMSTTANRFTIALRGLSAGEHTLTYSAVDEAGNELTDEEIVFEVRAHAAYEIDIRPGWNLISFPGTPADESIGGVMGTDLDAAIVLGYQNGAWVSAIRNQGEWQGTLQEIVGGYGYWVQTTVFESISAVIPPTDPTDVLPSVPVIAGWNLLGVVDIAQGPQNEEPIGKEEADDYFVSIDWRVGYYFRNVSNDWQKIVPDAAPSDGGSEILNGKGYWIWSIRPGKLVP